MATLQVNEACLTPPQGLRSNLGQVHPLACTYFGAYVRGYLGLNRWTELSVIPFILLLRKFAQGFLPFHLFRLHTLIQLLSIVSHLLYFLVLPCFLYIFPCHHQQVSCCTCYFSLLSFTLGHPSFPHPSSVLVSTPLASQPPLLFLLLNTQSTPAPLTPLPFPSPLKAHDVSLAPDGVIVYPGEAWLIPTGDTFSFQSSCGSFPRLRCRRSDPASIRVIFVQLKVFSFRKYLIKRP